MFLKVHMYTANQTQFSTCKWNLLTVDSGLLDLKTAVFYCSLKIKQSQAITGLKKRKSHRKDPSLIALCYFYCNSVFIGHLLPELFFSLWLSSCDPDLRTSWFLLVAICFLSLWYRLRNIYQWQTRYRHSKWVLNFLLFKDKGVEFGMNGPRDEPKSYGDDRSYQIFWISLGFPRTYAVVTWIGMALLGS